ncbi:MAG: PDDEXK nuclease domain-containing protein [Candidatus Methanoplasma sp.]|jgi:predicted nuclease of restriction endonuclease-like (RecB) superfamily|nr:PDDEXK nuclease domain-containing protein [Candidatus Methanoplasma sp.]
MTETSNENALFDNIAVLIEQSKSIAAKQVNNTVVVMFWQVGRAINVDLLQNKRADYGRHTVATLADRLTMKYGRNFEVKNLRRMMQFAEQFADFEIVVTLSRQLTWSHFLVLLPLKSDEAKIYYANETANGGLGVRDLRKMISRKAFERREIANTQITLRSIVSPDAFKDPYLFDFLQLADGYLEADLEAAILAGIERFILEVGRGFAFVARQKRMIIDGKDFHLDLLFYHRSLKRLVAVELKLGQFEAEHNGQMKLYLKWLNRYERQEGENTPIGLILCAETSREQIELLEMDKDGIMVAEYWTAMPPKGEFERRIHTLLMEAKARSERRQIDDSDTPMLTEEI